MSSEAPRLPLLPFDEAGAGEKVRFAEDGWNGRNPAEVARAYTPDSTWRNRAEIRKFLWPLGRRPGDHPGLSDLCV